MDGSDAVVILTEWNQFRNLDMAKVKELLKTFGAGHLTYFRNVYTRERMEQQGFKYVG
jgi:UDPglucose 6-dehydrogenase